MTNLHGKRILSLLLVFVMLFSTMPVGAIAEELHDAPEGDVLVVLEETPTAEPVVEITAEPVVEITAEPVVEITAEPVVEITAEPVVEITAEPVVEITAEPVVEVTEEPVVEITEEPVVEVTAEPVVEVTAEPVVEVTEEPVVEVTEEPVVEVTEEPVVEVTAEPVVEVTEEPVVEVTAEPVVEATEEPVVEATEEPVVEPSEYEKLIAKVDALLVEYLGEKFADAQKTNEEILAEVNGMSAAEIAQAVEEMDEGTFAALCKAISNIETAAEALAAAEADAVLNRGVFAALRNAAEKREEAEIVVPTEEPVVEATEEPVVEATEEPVVEATEEPVVEATEEPVVEATEEPVVEATEEPVVEATEEPVVEATEEPVVEATEEPVVEETITTPTDMEPEVEEVVVNEALEAVRAQFAALNVPAYTEETLWAVLTDVIAVQQSLGNFDAYLQQIAAAKEALNLLPEEDKAAVEAEYAYVFPYAALLPVKANFDSVVANYYREISFDRWILFETMLALMDPAEIVACAESIAAGMQAVEALPEAEKALFKAFYTVQIDFLAELYAQVAPMVGQLQVKSRGMDYDTSVSADYFKVIQNKTFDTVGGVVEADMVLNNAEGSDRKVVHVFEVDASKVEVLPGYYNIKRLEELYNENSVNGVLNETAYNQAVKDELAKSDKPIRAEQLTKTVEYYKSIGYNVIGAMNTALAYDSDAPYGYMVYKGQVLGTPTLHKGAQTYLAIDKNGFCELRSMGTELTGNEYYAISANFGWLVKDGALVSTNVERTSSDASRSMLGIKADGTLMIVHCDGRNAPISTGLSNYEMGELMLALGCVNAVNGDGGGSSTFISQRSDGLIMRSVPSDGSERPTINSIILATKVGETAKFAAPEIVAEYDYMVPGVSYPLEVLPKDTLGTYTVPMPEGGVWSVDETYGTISQDGVFTANETLINPEGDAVVIKYTVDGKVGEKTITVANPAVAEFAQESTVLPFGKTAKLEMTVNFDDAGDFPMYYTLDAFTWEVSDPNAGTLDIANGTYTATRDETVQGVVLSATYKYADMGKKTFGISFGKGSELVLTPEGNPRWDFENGDVSDWMCFDEAKAWSQANGVNNTLVGASPLAGQYSDEVDGRTFLATRGNGQVKNGNYALGITLDYTTGAYASWTYNVLFNVGEPVVLRDVANGKNATTLGFWLYIPEGAAGLAFQSQLYTKVYDAETGNYVGLSCKQNHFTFTTVDGTVKNLNSCTEADIPANRWVYASINISGYDYLQTGDPYDVSNSRSPSFMRTYIKPNSPQNLTFYIDDITLDYSPATPDRSEPVISDPVYIATDEEKALTEGATIAASSASFAAKVSDDNLDATTAQIYIDGVKVDTQVVNGKISTVTNVNLENGTHKVTFEIADKVDYDINPELEPGAVTRNWAQKNIIFTVAGSEEAIVSIDGHNDSGDPPEYDSVYYVDVKTSDVSKIQKVVANIQLNTANTWELEQMIVAPGFTAEYELLEGDRSKLTKTSRSVHTDIHSVENVVRITLTKTEDCKLEGEQILVSLPVRLWSWDAVNHITGEPIEPEKQFATGNNPIVTVDVEVLFGQIEMTNGETTTFNGSFSKETKMNDSVNPWHYHDAELTVLNQAATCFTPGYENRTYCETCKSVVDWGTVVPAGHTYEIVNDQLVCKDCGKVITGSGIVEANGVLYCLIADKLVTGWQMVDGGWCYADPTTKIVATGEKTVSGLTYTFGEDGVLVKGAWVTDTKGTKYSYGPAFYNREWVEIDGAKYYFGTDSYMYTGIRALAVNRNNIKEGYHVYDFGTDGKLVKDFATYNGIITTDGDGMFYMVDGLSYYAGLLHLDTDGDGVKDAYYYARTGGTIVCGKQYWITKNNDILPVANYTFGDDGKMINPPAVEEPDDPDQPGTPVEPEKKNGIVEEDGKKYWYVDDVKTYGGLLYLDTDGDGVADAYYYARSSGEIICGRKYWITKNNDLLPVASYTFGEDGKMIDPPVVEEPDDPDQPETPVEPEKKNGIVEEDGKKYWYVDDVKTYGGLLYLDTDGDGENDAYYYARSSGEIICGRKYWITKNNDLLPVANYTFGEDGKMIDPPAVEEPDDPDQPETPVEPEKKNGIVEEDGKKYWYVDDVKTYGGLLYLDTDGDGVADAYYYARSSGEIICGRQYWITKSNDLLPVANYTFGDDGKMIDPPVVEEPEDPDTPDQPETPVVPEKKNGIVEEDGKKYWYVDDVKTYAGLLHLDTDGDGENDAYYYARTSGEIVCGRKYWITKSNDLLPVANYTFGEDGKMIDPPAAE